MTSKIYVNGKQQQTADVRQVVIYGHGVKLLTLDDFGGYDETRGKSGELKISSAYASAPEAISLTQEIKNARKENLNRTDNYFLVVDLGRYYPERGKALYIHESEIAVEDLGDVLAMESDEERNYLHAARLTFAGAVTFKRLHAERIPCGGDWTIPEAGGKRGSYYGTEEAPCYQIYNNADLPASLITRHSMNPAERGVIKRWSTLETVNSGATLTVAERYYTKTLYSAERERRNNLAEAVNASKLFGQTFSHYDIEKLEKVFGQLTAKGV